MTSTPSSLNLPTPSLRSLSPPPDPSTHPVITTDCAVCNDNYALGYAHTCRSCGGDNKTRAIGGASVVIVVSLAVVALVISRLVAVVDVSGGAKALGPWGRRMAHWRAHLRKTFPLNAVKIVVVVWQIVTQVNWMDVFTSSS